MEDTVLSIDIGQDDCFYRILRSRSPADDSDNKDSKDNNNSNNNNSNPNPNAGKRIVYVVLKDLDFVPEPARSSGPDIIRILSRLPEWPISWKTLTITPNPSPGPGPGPALPHCEPDEFPPHALSRSQLFGDYPFFNILDLIPPTACSNPDLNCSSSSCLPATITTTSSSSSPPSPSLSSSQSPSPSSSSSSFSPSSPASIAPRPKHKQARRTFRIPNARFLKLARFAFELPWLAQEILAHHILAHRDRGMASLAPRILGYAYEDSPDRVVGLLTEELRGRRPTAQDLPACQAALQSLHDLDILHGDVARENMFVTHDSYHHDDNHDDDNHHHHHHHNNRSGPAVVKFIDFEEACVGPLGDQADWEARKAEEMGGLAEKLMTADHDL